MRRRKNKSKPQKNQIDIKIPEDTNKSLPIYVHYFGAVLVAIVLSFAFHFMDIQFFHYQSETLYQAKVIEGHIIDKYQAHELSSTESTSLSNIFFDAALRISSEGGGKGILGMLYLLAASDYSPTAESHVENLVNNYLAMNFTNFALEQIDHVLSLDPKNKIAKKLAKGIKKKQPSRWKEYQKSKKAIYHKSKNAFALEEKSDTMPKPHFSLLFATLIGRYDLRNMLVMQMNIEFYESIKTLYDDIFLPEIRNNMEEQLTDTQLNHIFHYWQMEHFKKTGNYHPKIQETKLFSNLMAKTREACRLFFVSIGYSQEQAAIRASHELIFWISVHTPRSVHYPHKTDDALLGGVYYVRVPDNSGKLALFDPRGMSPILESPDPDPLFKTQKVPSPPFHRTTAIDPYDGLLILFPGWLVHQVLPSSGLSEDEYRVSISLNLKGEWQDTAHMMIDHINMSSLKKQ